MLGNEAKVRLSRVGEYFMGKEGKENGTKRGLAHPQPPVSDMLFYFRRKCGHEPSGSEVPGSPLALREGDHHALMFLMRAAAPSAIQRISLMPHEMFLIMTNRAQRKTLSGITELSHGLLGRHVRCDWGTCDRGARLFLGL